MNVSKSMGVITPTVSPEELFQVLTDATSQDPLRIQTSSNRFKEMLQQSGVFDALHQIAAEKSLPLPVRQQASIQFKNEALKNWRSRKLQNEEQRNDIRARFLNFLDEEDDIIADCTEVSISKIARIDYPDNWPSLLPNLKSVIDTHFQNRYMTGNEDLKSALILRRALQFLRGILKEFASMKMLNGVKNMSQLVDNLHADLFNWYSQINVPLKQSMDAESPRTLVDLFMAHLVYKSVSSVAAWLWQRCDKMSEDESRAANQWLQQVFQYSAMQLKFLAAWRIELVLSGAVTRPQSSKVVDLLTRHIRLLGKFFRRLSQLGQKRFAEVPNCDDLILFYWSQVVDATTKQPPPGWTADWIADSNFAPYPVRFLVQGLMLFKETLGQWKPMRRDGTPNKLSMSREFIEQSIQILVTRFLPLNTKDLTGWMEDPEEWVNVEDKESDQWEYELRPCSERVLIQLSNQYSESVIPLLQSSFNQVADKPAPDLDSAIQKEALYCAIGRCCQRLKGSIPFNEWLQQTLIVEAHDTSPHSPILKRRIAWVLGKWMSEQCVDPNNPLIWRILVHLLGDRQPGTDTVVRLTAAVALREGVDTLEFDLQSFAQFLPDTVTYLVTLMGEADTLESKRRVDDALNVVIDRAGQMIAPLVDKITGPLPGLWTDAGEDWLFKASLLTTMTNVVKAVGGLSTSLANIVVPLVEESMKVGTQLDNDGIILWKEAMRNTLSVQSVSGSPALENLLPLAVEQLGQNLDLLGSLLDIMESYFLLDGARILESQERAVEVFKAFLSIFDKAAMRENVKSAMKTLALLVQITPSNLWGLAMHTSDLFKYLLSTIMEGELDAIILTEEIHLISRIVLADRQIFLQLMQVTAPRLNMSEAKVFELLLEQWWVKFDAMSEPRHRKLSAMGVAALVSTGRPEVLERVPSDIFNMWLDVFGEIREAATEEVTDEEGNTIVSPLNLKRHWELGDAPAEYYQETEGTPEYERRKRVYDMDPVRTLKLSSFIRDRIQEAEAICGSQTFQQLYLSKADPTVLSQIQNELAG
ncbi:hypothetical protein VKT23_001903 [Stygiomarasmius scandens]|uniref:Importin N-terminal domain-containing protein n=1 Tax=Marasmiellus scandens TaxID=2682957 RepID=A0ABR1K4F5_9AGAR